MSDSLRRELGTESSYAYLRLLLPDCDSARKVYNVKETAMGKLLIKALRIPEGNIKAQRLIHYKNGTINPEGTGDLPATLESILKDGAFAAAHTDQAPLTIGEVVYTYNLTIVYHCSIFIVVHHCYMLRLYSSISLPYTA
jgi:DNA ligase N terminus